ncbi:kynureninase [Ascobolus immersus RN42]|uniref:Kynureninase n=1 Tax=Ascobolus immersus RN42 TaxID=1160509 RepID=A0A3N4HYK4_ASCIM|nr:kynureninase [Ascobolus immersus RN42]
MTDSPTAFFTASTHERPSERAYAVNLDSQSPLKTRSLFQIPDRATVRSAARPTQPPHPTLADDTEPSLYFAGNSLGLLPLPVQTALHTELQTWGQRGVLGHFSHPSHHPWVTVDDNARHLLSPLLGSLPSETAIMGSLTSNIHLLFAGFYKPTPQRFKIIMEKGAFPSDRYAMLSQIEHHGLNPVDVLVEVTPAPGEKTISLDQIKRAIDHHANETAVVFFGGVQYLTGQVLDMASITAYAKHKGVPYVGFDLAHAVGNIPLELHAWNVDFAAWCSYKYLNAGPGGIAGIFVHEANKDVTPGFRGWWGHETGTRFEMTGEFVGEEGAGKWRLSNPSVVDVVALEASLRVFKEAGGIQTVREVGKRLTAYLEHLLLTRFPVEEEGGERPFEIVTPEAPWRGQQLSLRWKEGGVEELEKRLFREGVVVDTRRPDVVRVSPAPLYNSFADVWDFVDALKKVVDAEKKQ